MFQHKDCFKVYRLLLQWLTFHGLPKYFLKLGVSKGKADLNTRVSMKPGFNGHISHWNKLDLYSTSLSAKYLIFLGYVFKGSDDLHNTAVQLEFKH